MAKEMGLDRAPIEFQTFYFFHVWLDPLLDHLDTPPNYSNHPNQPDHLNQLEHFYHLDQQDHLHHLESQVQPSPVPSSEDQFSTAKSSLAQ